MERLTKKDKELGYIHPDMETEYNEDIDFLEIITKLGQLEDIEEELGIEITVLYKALKQGFYHKDDFGYIEFISGYMIKCLNQDKYNELKKEINNYGKTWALTKEELEK